MSTRPTPPISQSQRDDVIVPAQLASVGETAALEAGVIDADLAPETIDASIASPPVAKPDVASQRKKRSEPAPRPKIQRTPLGKLLHVLHCLAVAWEVVFGAISVMVILAVLATVPLLNILSLGYLLEASGRVARTGKIRKGFIGLPKAYRVGAIVAGTWICLLPLRLLSDVWYEASLIDPGSVNTFIWRMVLIVTTILMVAHILVAWYAGGKLRHFFWPIVFPLSLLHGMMVWADRKEVVHNQWPPPILLLQGLWKGDMYTAGRDEVWDFVTGLRLPYYFWLGLRGFAGALIWLFVPVSILMIGANLDEGGGVLFGFFGSILLAIVVLYLPFMQAHFAAENRFKAMFDWWGVRMHFRRAPVAFWIALLVTLLFAVPLYLLKIEVTPAEVTWIPALIFVAFILPARLITGWAMGRARRREQPRFILVRWLFRFAAVPVVFTYVFFVFLSQYLSWYGPYSFLEQHAFLVPVPFLGI